MDIINNKYLLLCNKVHSTREHLDALRIYASQCEHITECGVSAVVTTWAFMKGLLENTTDKKRLLSIDLKRSPNIDLAIDAANKVKIKFDFVQGSDLVVPIETTDMTYIDTWHIYGHLKREFKRFAPITRKYIILHDTTVDAMEGESIRMKHDINKMVEESGYPIEEIKKGIWPAVEEFLNENPEWYLVVRYVHCYGLTVLARKGVDIPETMPVVDREFIDPVLHARPPLPLSVKSVPKIVKKAIPKQRKRVVYRGSRTGVLRF